MTYVDGFIVPVRKAGVDTYKQIATEAAEIWRKHGALEVRECESDDVEVGEVTSFPRSVKLEDDETVFFSWIVFESRAHRDSVNAEVMKDPRFKEMMEAGESGEMPIDGKRMIYGGFEVVVDV